ncbi:unnamed protein product, partial [marine sediment metagenome]
NPTYTKSTPLFGEFLVSKGILNQEQLTEALDEQRNNGGRLGEVLLRLRMLSEKDVASSLAEYFSVECASLDDISRIDMDIARMLPEAIAKRFCLVVVGQEDDQIVVAMSDPLNVVAIDTITLKLGYRVKVVVGSVKEINHAIETIYHGSDVEEQSLRDLVVECGIDKAETQEQEKDLEEANISSEVAATRAPVIRFVDLLLSQAVKSRASDIHIEPQEKSMSVRMRIDGVLQ